MDKWARAVRVTITSLHATFWPDQRSGYYVKQLLVFFHVGFMWLDKPHSIDVDLILAMKGLLRLGKDP